MFMDTSPNLQICMEKEIMNYLNNICKISQCGQNWGNIKKYIYSNNYYCDAHVEDISNTRIEFFKKEKIYYSNLKKYFYFKGFIISLFENNILKYYYEYIDNVLQNNIPFEYYKHFCLINIDNIWAEFYSDFIKERGNKKIILDNKKDYFINFFEKFNEDWIDYSKEIYGENFNEKIKCDIFLLIMKNLKEKYINCKLDINSDADDISNFKRLLSRIELDQLLK